MTAPRDPDALVRELVVLDDLAVGVDVCEEIAECRDALAPILVRHASPEVRAAILRELQEMARAEELAAFHAMFPECPAYPGLPNECDPELCDCGQGDPLVRMEPDTPTPEARDA